MVMTEPQAVVSRGRLQKRLPVIEIYGPVIQGEGALIGRATVFVRLGGCDYRCSWCDSMFAVDPIEVHKNAERLTAQEIIDRVSAVAVEVHHVTLSGGNPVMHDCDMLVKGLWSCDYDVAVETQGTMWRPWLNLVDLVTISPKPPSSGMVTDIVQLDKFVNQTASGRVLKVVVFDERDFEYARSIHRHFLTFPLYLQVGNAVGEDGPIQLLGKLQWLMERVLEDPEMQDCIVLPQLHTLVYGNERRK